MKRSLWTLCWLIVVLLFVQGTAAGADDKCTRLPLKEQDIEPFLRSDYYGVYLVGQKVGYGKMGLARGEDAKDPSYVATVEFTVKLTSAGVQTEISFTQTNEFDAKSPYALRRGVLKETDGKTAKEIDVRRTDKGYDVTVTAGGEKQKKQIAALDYTLADGLTPSLWLRQGAKVGDTITTRTFDFDELKLEKEIRKLAASKTTTVDGVKMTYHEVEVTIPKDDITGKERYAEKADYLLSMQLAGVMEMRLEPEKQAKDAKFSTDLFVLGTVKIDKPLGDAAKVACLVIEITGKEAESLKAGPRQAVSRNDAGNVICKLGKEYGQPVKATEKEIEENLAETTTVPISNPKVQALAKEAVGDAQTPKEKVERITRFVYKYIQPSYTANPLTLLDLIKNKKGDCTEYALLFTALARASGIPTREMSGLVYMGDDDKAFGPHAWNEVVLDGHWVPIDASCNETEINATHLSFGTKLGDTLSLVATFGKLSFKLVEVKQGK